MCVFMYAPVVCHSLRMRTGLSDSISASSVEEGIDPIVPCNLRELGRGLSASVHPPLVGDYSISTDLKYRIWERLIPPSRPTP